MRILVSELLSFLMVDFGKNGFKLLISKTLIIIRRHNYFIIQGYMFRPFKRSSSGLLTD